MDDVTFTDFDDDAIDFDDGDDAGETGETGDAAAADDETDDDETPKSSGRKKATRKKAAAKTASKGTRKKTAKSTKATKSPRPKAARKTAKKAGRKTARPSDEETGSDADESSGEGSGEGSDRGVAPAAVQYTEAELEAELARRMALREAESGDTERSSDRVSEDEIDFDDDESDDEDRRPSGSRGSRKIGRRKSRDDDRDDHEDRDDQMAIEFDDEESSDERPNTRGRKGRSPRSRTGSAGDTEAAASRDSDEDDLELESQANDRSSDRTDDRTDDRTEEGRSRRSRSRRGRSRDDDRGSDRTSDNGDEVGFDETDDDRDPRGSRSDTRDDRTDDREGQPKRRRRRRGRRGKGGGENSQPSPQSKRSRRGRGGKKDRTPTVSGDYSDATGPCDGVLEMHPKGYGFLRAKENDYAAQEADPFVSAQFIERYCLREGVFITGELGPGHRNQGPRVKEIETVEGMPADDYCEVKDFDKLTPVNPFEQIKLEVGPSPITMRVMDLLSPIGKGQRALLVAPPRSGKTILLQQIADSVAFNHPECKLMVLLIDERPEEVTEMRRHVKGEVIASTLDNNTENHVRVSQLVVERAKRLAERGEHVFILLDSITRLARAFNKYGNSGATGSGGVGVRALEIPKKLFGTARRFDEGGSVTVVGTALVETGGRMDDVIFQEFKGTGNMELVLSRDLADRRIFPAIDISRTGTRREELLVEPETLDGINMMRRSLLSLHPVEAMEQLIRTLAKFDTNDEFLAKIRSVM